MKNEYLVKLKELLDRYNMDESEKQDILNDYEDMFDGWKDRGMSDEEVEQKLGKPRNIISSLTEGYKRIPKPQTPSTKIIALSPFVATIIFFVLGFGFDGWAYAWMAYFLIPVTAITIEMGKSDPTHLTTALSPFVAAIAYFILGFFYQLWHPGWLVFIIIPILGVFNSRKEMNFLTLVTALSPFAAAIAFVILGEAGYWYEGWLVFLVVPFFAYFHESRLGRRYISILLLIVGAIGYLYVLMYTDLLWGYGLLAFVPYVVQQILIGNIIIYDVDGEIPNGYKYTVVIAAILYFAVSFLTGWWAITWLIFLAIPVYAINKEVPQPEKVIALSPFIALSLFMLLGFFLGIWAWAWIAFLIIPMTAIVKSV